MSELKLTSLSIVFQSCCDSLHVKVSLMSELKFNITVNNFSVMLCQSTCDGEFDVSIEV